LDPTGICKQRASRQKRPAGRKACRTPLFSRCRGGEGMRGLRRGQRWWQGSDSALPASLPPECPRGPSPPRQRPTRKTNFLIGWSRGSRKIRPAGRKACRTPLFSRCRGGEGMRGRRRGQR
jgi:hypothetical protein